MADKSIGALPNLAEVQDDAKLPVECNNETYHLTGAQWKAYAKQAVAEEAEKATNAAKVAVEAKQDLENAKSAAETAAKSATENATATTNAKNTAVSAAERAQGYTTNPPKPSEDGTVWMLWDGEKYVTTEIPARSEVLPKIWTADFQTTGLAGELIALSNLSGPEEATVESVNSGDFLISTKDGGILRIGGVHDNYFGTPIPVAGTDITIYGYLPKYPATLTVGFSEGCDFICDGVDDQVEIMEALKALPPLGGKIWFEGGTYNLSAAVQPRDESNANVHLGDVELYCNIDSRAHFAGNYTGGFWRGMFSFFDAERITMRNFSMKSNPADTGIELGELSCGARLENLILSGFSEAIAMRNWIATNVLEIVGCRITETTLTSINVHFAHIKDCYISGGTYGVATSEGGSNCMVQNCVILDVKYGVSISQPGVVISGNTIRASSKPVSTVADKGAVVAGNTFVGVNVTEVDGNTYVGNRF